MRCGCASRCAGRPRERTRRVGHRCPYCGVGCGLIADVAAAACRRCAGDPLHPVNRGATCRKPLRLPEALHAPDRATEPLWRDALDERWRAGDLARRRRRARPRLQERAAAPRPGRDRVLHLRPAADRGLLRRVNKLAKGFLGTNNVDSNSRLCMSSAVAGYTGALGSDGPPPSYADIDEADSCSCSAPTPRPATRSSGGASAQPAGRVLIVVDPRRTPTAELADLHLPVRPGADLPLLTAMLHVLDARRPAGPRLHRAPHARAPRTRWPPRREWPPERAAEVCGVRAEEIVAAARALRPAQARDGAVVDGRQPVDGRDAQEPAR